MVAGAREEKGREGKGREGSLPAPSSAAGVFGVPLADDPLRRRRGNRRAVPVARRPERRVAMPFGVRAGRTKRVGERNIPLGALFEIGISLDRDFEAGCTD